MECDEYGWVPTQEELDGLIAKYDEFHEGVIDFKSFLKIMCSRVVREKEAEDNA